MNSKNVTSFQFLVGRSLGDVSDEQLLRRLSWTSRFAFLDLDVATFHHRSVQALDGSIGRLVVIHVDKSEWTRWKYVVIRVTPGLKYP